MTEAGICIYSKIYFVPSTVTVIDDAELYAAETVGRAAEEVTGEITVMKRIGVPAAVFVMAIVQHSRSVLLPMTFDVYDVPEVALKSDEDSNPLKQKVLKLMLLPSEKVVVEQ